MFYEALDEGAIDTVKFRTRRRIRALGRSRPALQESASRSETRVHDWPQTTKTWDSRPRFSGVGCDVLTWVPACHAPPLNNVGLI
jgi:hypothetical protein